MMLPMRLPSRRCWPQLHRFSLEDDVCGAIAVRRLEFVTHLAIAQQRQPLFRHRWEGNSLQMVYMEGRDKAEGAPCIDAPLSEE
jgi:hypothetical protein